MLRSIDGGRRAERTLDAGGALEEFLAERSAHRDELVTALVVAEVLASFLLESGLAGDSADEDDDAPPGPEALADVPAARLARAAGPCLELFPYQCVVTGTVLERLRPGMHALVAWLVARGAATPADRRAFERAARHAAPALDRQLRLQRAIEALDPPVVRAGSGERIVGHFLVLASDPRRLELGPPDGAETYRVLLPAQLPERFPAGSVAGFALAGTALGCLPLAATLPIRPTALESLLDDCLGPLEREARGPAPAR
ncbi:MAG: hypothetical protein D6738_03000 [Acidobacteria bacterium]|nr:MAG: hypothetical protein D6738_03000 [Acidobacteriota bacterium]